jgi:hypothetical protein
MKPIILFFIIYIFVWNLANADEMKLECNTFVKEEICNMTDEEQEKWFWELFQSLIEEDIQPEPVLPKPNERETIAI